jgi:hypothetical protein
VIETVETSNTYEATQKLDEAKSLIARAYELLIEDGISNQVAKSICAVYYKAALGEGR